MIEKEINRGEQEDEIQKEMKKDKNDTIKKVEK